MTTGRGISGTAAALAILGFFLPWVLVSCMGEPLVPMSGYGIASGNISSVFGPSDPIPGRPLLFITLGAAVFAFLIFLISYFISRLSLILSSIQAIIGIVGIAPIFLTFAQMKSEYSEGMKLFGIDLQYGFWMTIVGFAGIVIGGLLSMADSLRIPTPNKAVERPPDIASQLARLVELHNEGSLSDDEFESAKKKLLS
jgi:hypothetical protein